MTPTRRPALAALALLAVLAASCSRLSKPQADARVQKQLGAYTFVMLPGGTLERTVRFGRGEAAPLHYAQTVSVPGFAIAAEPVSRSLWCAVMEQELEGDADAPVTGVSWYNAAIFCNLLSEHAGLLPCYSFRGGTVTINLNNYGYRLPTRAEWQYAARRNITQEVDAALSEWCNDTDGDGIFASVRPLQDDATATHRVVCGPLDTALLATQASGLVTFRICRNGPPDGLLQAARRALSESQERAASVVAQMAELSTARISVADTTLTIALEPVGRGLFEAVMGYDIAADRNYEDYASYSDGVAFCNRLAALLGNEAPYRLEFYEAENRLLVAANPLSRSPRLAQAAECSYAERALRGRFLAESARCVTAPGNRAAGTYLLLCTTEGQDAPEARKQATDPLADAVRAGDAGAARDLLVHGADAFAAAAGTETPLGIARGASPGNQAARAVEDYVQAAFRGEPYDFAPSVYLRTATADTPLYASPAADDSTVPESVLRAGTRVRVYRAGPHQRLGSAYGQWLYVKPATASRTGGGWCFGAWLD